MLSDLLLRVVLSWRARTWKWHHDCDLILTLQRRSMLHWEILTLLRFLAKRAGDGILEIGPYKGAATALMARKMKDATKLVTVEVGGSHNHPEIPSQDIACDLMRTLTEFGVRERVTVVSGWSHEENVKREVRAAFGSRKIGLLFIDANGRHDLDLRNYGELLGPRAFVVLDDYDTGGTNEKEESTRRFVNQFVGSGRARELGVFRTAWFGRLTG